MRRLALLAFVCVAAVAAVAAPTTYKVGDEVADATLAMADGKEKKLSSYEGDAVLLFFYEISGRRAAADAKAIDAVRRARAKQKFAAIGVARDAKAADAKKFADDNQLGFPQACDAKAELYAKFATKGLPWIAVLDGKRKVKHSAAGIDEDALDVVLTELLGAKDGAAATKKDDPGSKSDDGGKK